MPATDLVHMREEGMDWLMRPVINGMCNYESLKDSSLDLADVSRMNEAIDVEHENRFRLHQAMKDG